MITDVGLGTEGKTEGKTVQGKDSDTWKLPGHGGISLSPGSYTDSRVL